MIGRRSPRSCHSDRTELVSLDCLFILWVYSFELPSTSSTHCPEREAENGSAYTWKDPSRNLKSMGDQSSAEAETKASRGSYANHHAYQKSIDSPPYTLPAPAGLFSICNKNCWLENSPLIISPESQSSSFVVHHSRRRKHTYRK